MTRTAEHPSRSSVLSIPTQAMGDISRTGGSPIPLSFRPEWSYGVQVPAIYSADSLNGVAELYHCPTPPSSYAPSSRSATFSPYPGLEGYSEHGIDRYNSTRSNSVAARISEVKNEQLPGRDLGASWNQERTNPIKPKQEQEEEAWDEKRLENLANTYIHWREALWRVLANNLGEDWAIVEVKVSSYSLQSSYSS